MPTTAAIIIIGNEILSGKVEDRNSTYLASGLRELGVDVRRISVVPDDVEVIAGEVAAFSRQYDHVFTSGGVGPTHDDVTMEGVARAFGLGLVRNAELADLISERCGGKPNDPTLKMADLPEGADLLEADGLRFPAVAVRNVYVFPGIPEYLVKKFEAISERFRSEPFMLRKIYIKEEECFIVPLLDTVVAEFPGVDVGSYPKVGLSEYKGDISRTGRLHMKRAVLIALLLMAAATMVFAAGKMPPADGAKLCEYMTKEQDYTKWALWPGTTKMNKGTQPHGELITTYVNDVALESLEAKKGMKPWSIISKENYSKAGKLNSVTVMYNVEGYDPPNGDWFWVRYDSKLEVTMEGKVEFCIGCHRAAPGGDMLYLGDVK
jgi:molybdenum cofactor synthesis domain-containing protein